ncbi:unnamed protein product [Schistosoma margrebowiei]|uniref:Uncharacterized protein n=1 Tax=Schistosoma margrebowiei TaxID=48269 RepID=A0AA85AI33_9TREM|nr:unnamed protein product [Schistosoma margrebowiei]
MNNVENNNNNNNNNDNNGNNNNGIINDNNSDNYLNRLNVDRSEKISCHSHRVHGGYLRGPHPGPLT